MSLEEKEANQHAVNGEEKEEEDKKEVVTHEADETEEMPEEEEDEEDDFGDFEEGESDSEQQQDIAQTHNQADSSSTLRGKEGQINELNDETINELVDKIFEKESLDEKMFDSDFKFSDRSQQLYENLVNTDEYPLQQMFWKQSIILKQLFLNLQIPIVENKFKNKVNFHKKINFKYDTDLKVNTIVQNKILTELNDLNKVYDADHMKDDFKVTLTNTDQQLSEIEVEINRISDLEKLNNIKKNLLKTLVYWHKQYDIIKEDNDLFTSYVENLVGNTQKFRRFNK